VKNEEQMDIDELKKKAQKESLEDAFCRLVLRNISIRITRYLVRTRIAPNQITILSFVLGVLAAICFAMREYAYLLAGAILVVLSVIFDLVDGEVARVKSLTSLLGAWLDPLLDMVRTGLLFLGIAIGLQTAANYIFVWIISYLAFFGLLVENYSSAKQLEAYGKHELLRVKGSSGGVVRTLYENLYGLGSITLSVSIGAVLNQLLVASMLLAVASNLDWISKFAWYYMRQKKGKDEA